MIGKNIASFVANQTGETSTVMTLPFRATLMENCRKKNDPLAIEVLGRLESCCDLVAAEAFYHRACYQAFVLKPIQSCQCFRFYRKPPDFMTQFMIVRLQW